MRVSVEWEVPVSVSIDFSKYVHEYDIIDVVSIDGFKGVYTRNRYSSFQSRQNVVDVKGEFGFDNRNGVGGFESKVSEIVIPALELQLTLTKDLGNDEYDDSEETINTKETILDALTFEDLENYGRMPDLNVTEINLEVDYDTKEVSINRRMGGIEWGRYYE